MNEVPVGLARSREEAKASYDKMSRWYDALWWRFETRIQKGALGDLRAAHGESVLEIGFGTGHCLRDLAQSVGESGAVCGIDLSQGMAAQARLNLSAAGVRQRVRLVRGDAARLPFADASFDAIFICFTLELFSASEIPIVLRECRRILRGRGRICVVAMSSGRKNPAMRFYAWANKRFPYYVDCRPICAVRALQAAGFQIRAAQEVPLWGLAAQVVIGTEQPPNRAVPV